MNILFLTSWYPTSNNPNFGIFIKEHAHAISSAGNNVVVLAIVATRSNTIWSKAVTDSSDENGVRTITIELKSRFRDIVYHAIPIQYYIAKNAAKKLIANGFEPEIIHSNVIFPAGIIGNWLADRLKKPHIISEHWSRIKGFLSKPIFGRLAIKSYQNAARILPVSFFLKKRMLDLMPTLDSSRFRIVGNVIDSNIFNYKDKNSSSETLHFCAVATWANKKVPDKIPELFIEALAQLQIEIKKSIQLTMVGGGDKIPEFETLCSSKGLNAQFVGIRTKNEIADYLQESDYFVHASTIETFGVVVAEALLCGTPVICSNVGALPEIINESNGVLCENTVENWMVGIKKAIETNFQKNEIASDFKQKFSTLQIGEEITSVYNDVYKSDFL